MKKQFLVIAVMGIIAISNVQVFGTNKGPVVDMNRAQVNATVAPQVTSTDPADKDTDIALDKAISVTFNMAMDPSTINNSTFILKQGEVAIAGKVEYKGTKATFTPTLNLAGGTVYTVTLTTGGKSSMGIPLETNTVFSFTTAGTPAITQL